MEEKYKVEMTKKQIKDCYDLIYFTMNHHPFISDDLSKLYFVLSDVWRVGCFEHNILSVRLQTSKNESITLCPKCSPKEYKELKSKYKEEQI